MIRSLALNASLAIGLCLVGLIGCDTWINPDVRPGGTLAKVVIEGPTFVPAGELQRFSRGKECRGDAFVWFFIPEEDRGSYLEVEQGGIIGFASRKEGYRTLGLAGVGGDGKPVVAVLTFYNGMSDPGPGPTPTPTPPGPPKPGPVIPPGPPAPIGDWSALQQFTTRSFTESFSGAERTELAKKLSTAMLNRVKEFSPDVIAALKTTRELREQVREKNVDELGTDTTAKLDGWTREKLGPELKKYEARLTAPLDYIQAYTAIGKGLSSVR